MHTNLPNFSIVGTCDKRVYQMRHKVLWFDRLVDSILLSICVITCLWKASMAWPCAKCFQKCFSEENNTNFSRNSLVPNQFYGLAIKGDSMSPQVDYLLSYPACYFLTYSMLRFNTTTICSAVMCHSRQVDPYSVAQTITLDVPLRSDSTKFP